MTHLSQVPVILADTAHGTTELAFWKAHGWKAVSYQAQNDHLTQDFDLGPARAVGLEPGVWGVSYRLEDFYRDGLALGRQALRLGAAHVMADLEFCLKGTRGTGWVRDHYVKGLRDAGWTGPVHLTTLGGPSNPRITPTGGGNDYGFDYASFIETGGGVFVQAYFNMADEYRPLPSVQHVLACGVPRDRINVMISVTPSEPWAPKPGVRMAGPEWVPLLREAGVTHDLSLFIARAIQPGDIEGLDALTLGPGPAPQPEPEPTPPPTKEPTLYPWMPHIDAARAELNKAVALMDEDGKSDAVIHRQRAGMADAILETTDAKRLEAYAVLAPIFGWEAPSNPELDELVAELGPHVEAIRKALEARS